MIPPPATVRVDRLEVVLRRHLSAQATRRILAELAERGLTVAEAAERAAEGIEVTDMDRARARKILARRRGRR